MAILNDIIETARSFNTGYNIGETAMKIKAATLGTAVAGTEVLADEVTTEVASEVASEVVAEEGASIFIEALSFFFE